MVGLQNWREIITNEYFPEENSPSLVEFFLLTYYKNPESAKTKAHEPLLNKFVIIDRTKLQ